MAVLFPFLFPVTLLSHVHMSLILVSLESLVHHSYHLSCLICVNLSVTSLDTACSVNLLTSVGLFLKIFLTLFSLVFSFLTSGV